MSVPCARCAAAAPERAAEHAWRFASAESLAGAGRFAAAQAFLDSALVAARRDGPDGLRMEALLRHGGAQAYLGRLSVAEPELREAIALASAHRDTFAECRALNWLASGLQGAGRRSEALRLNRRLLRLARALAREQLEGRAWTGLAYEDLLSGRYARARARYALAVKRLRRVGDTTVDLVALMGLGRAEDALGDRAAARATWTEVAALAHERRLGALEAEALTNLGAVEFDHGDPARAVDCWTRAYALLGPGSSNEARSALNTNLARALRGLGRDADAEALLERPGLPTDPASRARRLTLLANFRFDDGRTMDAIRITRAVLALGDSLPADREVDVRWQLAEALLDRGDAQGALAQCDTIGRRNASWGAAAIEAERLIVKGRALRLLGRLPEARAAFVEARVVAERQRLLRPQVWVAFGLSRVERDAGALGRARVEAERAVRLWERWRADAGDAGWRESRGQSAVRLANQFACVVLDPRNGGTAASRAHEAFAGVQPLKARTLSERSRGPGRSAARRATGPAPFTPATLRPGEVLLDAWSDSDTGFVFLVTRASVQAWGLPRGSSFADRVSRLRALLADGSGASAAVVDSAASAVGRTLFGPARGVLARARTVFVAMDGELESLPFAALGLCDADRTVIAELPSAGMLARLRARPARTTGTSTLLALGTGLDEDGSVLPGAASELSWLSQRYSGVRRRPAAGEGAGALVGAMARAGVVHVAAHQQADEQRPWDSGLFVGAAANDRWLRASQVAAARCDARLAVLSSCSSRQVGGRGEGVYGMAAAFLVAGVPTVIATHWPVEDAHAGAFVRDFYAALDDGGSAGEALTAARAAARRRPETSHPRDWAGYTLVGDPGTRVRLERAGQPRFPVTATAGKRQAR